jgi:hypothetical protein
MEKQALVEGRFYAYRESGALGTPFLKIKLLEKVTGRPKVKVRFENGPYPGLEEYALTRRLVVPWGDRKALVRDEERLEQLQEHARRSGRNVALAEAVANVLASSGEPSAWAEWDGVSMPEDELERIARRAGLEKPVVELHPLAFCDRRGDLHLPLEAGEALARAFAAAEPETVLMAIRDDEEELRLSGNVPGQRYTHDILRERLPGFAIARQWAGFDRELEQLQKEIGRLRMLVTSAAYELRAKGADREYRRLLRALDGG